MLNIVNAQTISFCTEHKKTVCQLLLAHSRLIYIMLSRFLFIQESANTAFGGFLKLFVAHFKSGYLRV